MTPFSEDILEIAPAMAPFLVGAKFYDLNHKSAELHERVSRFAKKDERFAKLHLEPGSYWIECSGYDQRTRIAFLSSVEGQELVSRVVVQDQQGQIGVADGVGWVLLSKLCPMVRAMPVDGKCEISGGMVLLLAACVEEIGK